MVGYRTARVRYPGGDVPLGYKLKRSGMLAPSRKNMKQYIKVSNSVYQPPYVVPTNIYNPTTIPTTNTTVAGPLPVKLIPTTTRNQ